MRSCGCCLTKLPTPRAPSSTSPAVADLLAFCNLEADMNVITHRRIDMLLTRYAESHRHPANEAIHCICVPAIVWSLLGLLWAATAALAVLVAAWIGQFIGHKIEGKKPSFFEDLRFLLIGPLFVLSVFYRRWRISY